MSPAATARRAGCWALALGCAVMTLACGSRALPPQSRPQPLPARPEVHPGDCADPTAHGVFGEQPSLWRADRDLDGDDVDEIVVADRTLCTPEGNCHWNLYRTEGECYRYLGTVSAASIQRLLSRGEHGFFSLRGWWRLTDDRRVLLQEYRFRRGGYRLVEALTCQQADDDRILCAEQGR